MGFDTYGDLWIQVDLSNIPDNLRDLTGIIIASTPGPIAGTYHSAVEFNLTKYIQRVMEESKRTLPGSVQSRQGQV
jgi:hypothetical protein